MSWTKLVAVGLTILGLSIVWFTRQIWAAAFLGVLFALCVHGPAQALRRHVRMPHWAATLLIMLSVIATLGALGWAVGPSLGAQAEILARKLPGATQNALAWLDQRPWGQNVLMRAEALSGVPTQQMGQDANDAVEARRPDPSPASPQSKTARAEERSLPENMLGPEPAPAETSQLPDISSVLRPMADALSLTLRTVALIVVTFVLMLFVAFDPAVYRRGVLWLVPSRHDAVAQQTLDRLAAAIRWWMLGRLTSMVVVGVLTSIGMWLIHMPAPMALGAIAGVLSFVPNIGPTAAALPGLLIALGQGPWMVLWALCVYVGAQLIESNAITPLVEQYAVSVPPGLLIVTQLVLATLLGVWGMIIATPLLVVVMVLVQQLYVRGRVGERIEVKGRV